MSNMGICHILVALNVILKAKKASEIRGLSLRANFVFSDNNQIFWTNFKSKVGLSMESSRADFSFLGMLQNLYLWKGAQSILKFS